MPKRDRILIVDDEEGVRTLLRDCFELDGYLVEEARNGAELRSAIERAPPDLITLDLHLGGENGLDLARSIRASTNVPIIMITGRGDAIDRIVGLELGADDYIAKPFHIREVLARVHSVLRRASAAPAPIVAEPWSGASAPSGGRLSFEGYTLDPVRRELKGSDGVTRDLTTAEFNLLQAFAERPGRVLSRDAIMGLLKGHDWTPFDRSIDQIIVRLRRKIEADPEAPRIIKTVRGVGYVFAVECRPA